MKAHVKNGHLVVDAPTNLPEGAEVELTLVDDDLDDEDRARLHAALDEAERDEAAGRMKPADEVLAELRERHKRAGRL